MGDTRYVEPYERFRNAKDRPQALMSLSDEELIAALAAASRERDPLAANVLATEAQNRAARWQRVTSMMGDALIVTSWPERKITHFNRAAQEMFGWTEDEVRGSTTEILYADREDFLRSGERWAEAVARRAPLRGLLELRHRDGAPLLAEYTITPLAAPSGEVMNLLALLRDVTEKHAAETALRESEERYRQVTLHSGIGVAIVGADGRFIEVNPELCRILGYSEPELLRKTFLDLTHPADLDADLVQARRLASGEIASYTLEKRYVRKDGEHVWAQLTGSAVRRGDGSLRYFVAQVQDIDERKRIQARLDVQNHVAHTLAAAQSIDAALLGTLHTFCDAMDWVVGEYWRVDASAREHPVLRRAHAVTSADPALARFRDEGGALVLAKGEGLAGSAWESGRWVRVEDVSEDPSFRRRASAGEARLRAGVAFPVYAEGRVHGVFTFFTKDLRGFDKHLAFVLEDVGRQVGQYLDREVSVGWTRALQENAPDATLVVDLGGKVLSLNAAGERLFGYRREEVLGMPVEMLVPDAQRDRHARERQAYLEDPHQRPMGVGLDLLARRKDGQLVPVEVSLSPVHAAGDTRILASVRDVSEHRSALARIGRMRRLFTTLATANEAILRADDEASVLDAVCRTAVEEGGFRMAWIGWKAPDGPRILPVASAGHVEGYLDSVVIRTDASPAGEGPTGRAVRTGRTVVVNDIQNEEAMRPWWTAASTRGYAASAAFPIATDAEVVGALSVYASQTGFFGEEEVRLLEDLAGDVAMAMQGIRRKRAVERANRELAARVAERTAQLSKANSELESFTYRVAHDLRAPLRGLDLLLEVVEQESAGRVGEEAREALAGARREARRLRKLAADLLALSRSGAEAPSRETVDLSAIARGTLAGLASREPERRVDWRVAEGLRADAEPGMARVVLENLLGNAWKFTARNPSARIEVGSATTEAGEKAFFVRDNGVGFPAEKVGELFHPFKRLHTGSEFEGTGVGLASVARIVQRHGGRAWAEGGSGDGATFWFTLAPPPRAKEAAP